MTKTLFRFPDLGAKPIVSGPQTSPRTTRGGTPASSMPNLMSYEPKEVNVRG
jgi:hypothetical protein